MKTENLEILKTENRLGPRLALSFCCLLLVGCGPNDAKSASDLAQCYEAEFGTPPPPQVKVLNARLMSIRDWGAQWLRLELSGNALESAILSRGFQKLALAPSAFTSADRYTPEWWRLTPGVTFEYYEHPNWTKGNWRSSNAVLAVDRSSGIAFLRCDRID